MKIVCPTCSTIIPHNTLEERFWNQVLKSEECWEWQGPVNENGYGILSGPTRIHLKSHRVAWELMFGEIPEGMCVCHSCDNPKCVKPDHLFLDTHAGNMKDKARKGRSKSARGELSHTAVLTAEQVLEIRGKHPTLSYSRLAKEYCVSVGAINGILNRRTWKHI
jgi:hypothetical protein